MNSHSSLRLRRLEAASRCQTLIKKKNWYFLEWEIPHNYFSLSLIHYLSFSSVTLSVSLRLSLSLMYVFVNLCFFFSFFEIRLWIFGDLFIYFFRGICDWNLRKKEGKWGWFRGFSWGWCSGLRWWLDGNTWCVTEAPSELLRYVNFYDNWDNSKLRFVLICCCRWIPLCC